MSALVLPLAFSAYNLVIMKNSLESSIPDSLVESAVIDGRESLYDSREDYYPAVQTDSGNPDPVLCGRALEYIQ